MLCSTVDAPTNAPVRPRCVIRTPSGVNSATRNLSRLDMAFATLQHGRLVGCASHRQTHSEQHHLLLQQQQQQQRRTSMRAEQQADNSASSSDDVCDETTSQTTAYDRPFPKTGLFSIADPKQEVYSKAGERFDPTKKGGRFKPEFIWQTNWQEALKRQEDLERQQEEYKQKLASGALAEEAARGPGVVSFSRLGALDDMSVDLTQELLAAKQRKQQQQQQQQQQQAAAAVRQQPGASSSSSSSNGVTVPVARPGRQAAARSPSYQFKDLPTQNEARKFKRSSRSAGMGTVASVSAVGQPTAEEAAVKAAAAAAEKTRYEQLKVEFQGWTLGFGLLGGVAGYYLYGSDVAISYALGSSAGLTYLRLLSRSVDAVGDQGMAGGMNSAIGQPRLLIPVVLALTYNRWNTLYAEDYGIHLNLYGMLVGFFTYKLAVIGRQGLQLLSDLSAPASSDSTDSTSVGSDADGDASSLDRIFVRKVMSE